MPPSDLASQKIEHTNMYSGGIYRNYFRTYMPHIYCQITIPCCSVAVDYSITL